MCKKNKKKTATAYGLVFFFSSHEWKVKKKWPHQSAVWKVIFIADLYQNVFMDYYALTNSLVFLLSSY